MGHHISGAIFKGTLEPSALERFDLSWQALPQGVFLLYFDNYYCEHWAEKLGVEGELELPHNLTHTYLLPHDCVIPHILRAVSGQAEPVYALIVTDYFGGIGDQCAALYHGEDLIPLEDTWINTALRALGVQKEPGMDEFDSVHLSNFRSLPDALDVYRDGEDETAWEASPPGVAQVVHTFWDSPVRHEFLAVSHYRKPTPFSLCLARLEALKTLSQTQSFVMTSYGKRHHITSQAAFRRWLREVFEGGLTHDFSSRLFPDQT